MSTVACQEKAIPLTDEMTNTDCEGHEIPRHQSRRLPSELLIAIADHLWSHQDILAFGLTCKDLFGLLVDKRRRSLEIEFKGPELTSVRRGALRYRLLSQQTAMLTIPCFERNGRGHYAPTNGTDQLSTQNECELAKGVREVTLRGYFSCIGPYTLVCFFQASGFKEMHLEMLRIDLHWRYWNLSVLTGMWVANLKVLKLPICQVSDYNQLGKALATMPRLVSLTITDLPDREEFISELGYLGTGIMACASTLRELDIEMTNYNRPCTWEGTEAFIEPEETGFFFRKLFPYPSADDSADEDPALRQCHSRSGLDPRVGPRLCLTKLRLKRMSLPWYSFGIIFNATTIKNVDLPYSMVDDFVWGTFKLDAHLHTLTEISYDMLSKEFLSFLGGQSSLQELTFRRPQDRYVGSNIVIFGSEPVMMFTVSRSASLFGPDAGAGYPSLDDFLSSLQGLAMLKHLVLPVDMYTITPLGLKSIAATLTCLEHLEIGFDYDSDELRAAFISDILCGIPALRKITFLSLMQSPPLPNFISESFHKTILSLNRQIPASVRLLRYKPPNQLLHLYCYCRLHWDIEYYYHLESPLDGEWWMPLPPSEGELIFAEGRTPRLVPVGKWDWETQAKKTDDDLASQSSIEGIRQG